MANLYFVQEWSNMGLFNFEKYTSGGSNNTLANISEFRKTIDNKTVVVCTNNALSLQAESFLKILEEEQKQTDILKDGYKIQIGWSIFFVTQESNEFVLYAPDFSKNPFADRTRNLTVHLTVQMQQNYVLRQTQMVGEQVSFQDTMLILKETLESKELYFERQKTDKKDDSGWYLGLLEDSESKNRPASDYAAIYTYQLLDIKPQLLKLLSLPAGCLAVIKNDEILEAVDMNDRRIL